ncbi:MAG: copper chaperone PCu(A)C [Gammaproteobacteria bacterium]
MSKLLAFVVASMLVLAAAFVPSFAGAQASPLTVVNAWVRKPPGVDTAAVYFVLKNTGPDAITITGASSPIADHVMVHESSTVDGQSRMRMKDTVIVQPGKSVAFSPGGLHVMLSGIHQDIPVGTKVPVTLQLAGGGQVSVTAVVRSLGSN